MYVVQVQNSEKLPRATLNLIFSVTFYLDLHSAISHYYYCNFPPSKVVNIYNVHTTQFIICWYNMKCTINKYSIA